MDSSLIYGELQVSVLSGGKWGRLRRIPRTEKTFISAFTQPGTEDRPGIADALKPLGCLMPCTQNSILRISAAAKDLIWLAGSL